MRTAVVGHVEWIEFAVVPHLPSAGEIVHADETFALPAGGGAVAAVQLAKLGGETVLYTALGDDELGHRALRELRELGLRVECVFRDEPQRRGFVHLDAEGERTITVLGPRLGPSADDPLPWQELAATDAVYLTAADPGGVSLARAAGSLVASTRALDALRAAGERLDVLVASATDAGERYDPGGIEPEPSYVVRTRGAEGGEWVAADGRRGSFEAAPLPGEPVDAYGCGDSFAAGVTHGLGSGAGLEGALELGARCGAACLTGRGPYEAQLRLA